jgi:hypothetical protein
MIPQRRSHDYVRHGTTTLFAAFNIINGTVVKEPLHGHRAAKFKKFLTTTGNTVLRGSTST